jgi:hypothetical protein
MAERLTLKHMTTSPESKIDSPDFSNFTCVFADPVR